MKSYGETCSINQQKPKTKMKIRNQEKYKETSHELLDWLQEFREKLVDESTSTDPWGNPEQGSQDRIRVSTVYLRTFRRTQIVISA